MVSMNAIRYGYQGAHGTLALQAVSANLSAGEFVTVVGPNGSGKTTLLRVLSGQLEPLGGTLEVAGYRRTGDIRSIVAYAPDTGGFFPYLTVAEHGTFLARVLPHWMPERWRTVCDAMGLPAGQRAGALSRGQKARLGIALAVSQNAPIWMFDEPLAGIDPESRDMVVSVLAQYLLERETTVVLATHEIDEVETLTDRVWVLDQGQIRIDEPAEAIRERTHASIQDFVRKGTWRL